MPEIKYYYNPKTLRYERTTLSVFNLLLNFLAYLTCGVLFFVGLVILQNYIVQTPLEKSLKAENAALKKENEEFRAKIESISKSDKNMNRKDQLAGAESDTIRMEATKGVKKSLGSVISMTSVKAVDEAASASEAVAVEWASSRSIGLSLGAKMLTVPAVKKNLVSRKSIAMSGLEIGEGLVGVTHDEAAMEPDTKELSVANVDANVDKIHQYQGVASIFCFSHSYFQRIVP